MSLWTVRLWWMDCHEGSTWPQDYSYLNCTSESVIDIKQSFCPEAQSLAPYQYISEVTREQWPIELFFPLCTFEDNGMVMVIQHKCQHRLLEGNMMWTGSDLIHPTWPPDLHHDCTALDMRTWAIASDCNSLRRSPHSHMLDLTFTHEHSAVKQNGNSWAMLPREGLISSFVLLGWWIHRAVWSCISRKTKWKASNVFEH